MSSVLIKGMNMPKSCYDCELDNPVCDKWIGFPEKATKRPNDCPLVEIPPHGRLIDADALKNRLTAVVYGDANLNYCIADYINTAATVIEAEEE